MVVSPSIASVEKTVPDSSSSIKSPEIQTEMIEADIPEKIESEISNANLSMIDSPHKVPLPPPYQDAADSEDKEVDLLSLPLRLRKRDTASSLVAQVAK